MVKIISPTLFLLLLSSISFSQWTQQNIKTTNTLLDIQYANSIVGFVSDDHGNIYKTVNKGLEWNKQNTGTTDFLNSISFINENQGWAIGMNTGTLIHTSNGGETWNIIKTGIGITLLDIQFVSFQTGWIVGYNGQIYKTIDGGNSWTQQTSGTSANLWSVYFLDENTGFATGNGVILKTINSGDNWEFSYQSPENKKIEAFKSIFFVDNNNGWAVGQDWENGDASIIHTFDGGVSWSFQNGKTNGLKLQSVFFIDSLNGWTCGEDGIILATNDGGNTWMVKEKETNNFLRDIYAIDNSNVYAVGINGTILTNSIIKNVVTFSEQHSFAIDVNNWSFDLGDYDNDDDLDIVITGKLDGIPTSKIFKNEGNENFTEQTSIALTGVYVSTAKWGDYDNDGDLDLHIMGETENSKASKIYRNEGNNNFIETPISLEEIPMGHTDWIDYDNDGDLDLFIIGAAGSSRNLSYLYNNSGNNSFTLDDEINNIPIIDFAWGGTVEWGDSDNDSDSDLLFSAYGIDPPNNSSRLSLYLNLLNSPFNELNITFNKDHAWTNQASCFGDYDNDGDLDIISSFSLNNDLVYKIYKNQDDNNFTEIKSVRKLELWNASDRNSIKWFDYDNDGDLDLFIQDIESKFLINNGNNNFILDTIVTNIPPNVLGYYENFAELGDYDNDGDIDLFLVSEKKIKLYRNNSFVKNQKPNPPMQLSSSVNGNTVELSWNNGSDYETPADGLTYNIAVGTSSGNYNILAPMANPKNGKRLIVKRGNTDHNNNWKIYDLEPGIYYWTVQSIDNSFEGSNFAEEQTFTVSELSLTVDWGANKGNFEAGSTQRITWSNKFVENIKLEYTTDAERTWTTIENNYPAIIGLYDWIIPNTPSIYCRIRITSTVNNSFSDIAPLKQPYSSERVEYHWYFTIYSENNWVKVNNQTTQNLTDIKFINDQNGIAWGNDILLETNDGGLNWAVKTNFESNGASFVDNNNGWIIVNKYQDTDTSVVLHTSDGGVSWVKQLTWYSFGVTGSGEVGFLNDITFIDKENGWIIAIDNPWYRDYSSTIFKTSDGGETWNKINSQGLYIKNLKFINHNLGWLLGAGSGMPGELRTPYETYLSINGGNEFNFSTANDVNYYARNDNSAYFLNSSEGWLSQEDYLDGYLPGYIIRLYKKTTSNNIWQPIYTSSFKGPKLLYFKDSNIGWFWGNQIKDYRNSNIRNNFICMTYDGGDSWVLQESDFINSLSKINSFFSLDGQTCWAVGDGGTLLHYGDYSNSSPGIWFRNIQISDNNLQNKNLSFGQSLNATSQIDNDLGESELPPPPPTGTFDARFILNNSSSTILDLRNSDETEIEWIIQVQPSSNGYPITFGWNKDNLPFGSFFLKDVIDGSIVNVDMKLEDSYTLTNESINRLKIVYKEQFDASVTNNISWNLLSVPLAADNMELTSVFPDATSSAFTFDGSYVSTNDLNNGVGYWIKFSQEGVTNVYGKEPNTPISVKKGWNLVGPYNKEINLDQIQTNPNGIISGNIYGFDNSYYIANKLEVGKGYWVKVKQDGEINFANTAQLGKKINSSEKTNEPIFSFNITANDGVSDSISLTFGLDSLATDGYDPLLGEEELPPLPPLGVFDIRIELPDTTITTYSDIRYLAVDCYEYIIKYQLGDSSNGLTLSWNLPEGVTLNISDLIGGIVFNQSFLSGEGLFTIANTNINGAKLRICYNDIVLSQNSEKTIPTKYSLYQNYPNPFNPSTTIKYSIPKIIHPSIPSREGKERSDRGVSITLKVYDVLGRDVATLVNKPQKPGYYEINFDASNLSSGVYYYRLKAGTFVETKKMILLK